MINKNLRKPTEPAFLRIAFLNHYLFADVLFTAYCTPEEMRYIYDRYAAVFGIHNRIWMDEIWGMESDTTDYTINVHINRLRKRFENFAEFEIQTVRGLGYKAVKKV